MPAAAAPVLAESSCGVAEAGSRPGQRADSPAATPHTADHWIAHSAAGALDEAARRAHNAAFERDELARYDGLFETGLPQPLNHEQRAAIVVDEDATLVVAAAGSGKTTLLLGKIGYLVMRGLARPGEIALLAFNNSVRAEIRERLAASHPGVAVHTFHSLGLEIVRAAAGGACRLSDMATDSERLRAFVADTLLALAEREPGALAEWLTAQFRPLRDRSDFATEREYKAWARRNPPLTLLGPRAANEPLREVADRLALAGVRYQPDAAVSILPAWMGLPLYRPQLLLPDARVVIDLAGPDGGAGHGGEAAGPGWATRLGHELLARLACLRHGYRRVRLAGAAALQREGRLDSQLAGRLAVHGLELAPRAIRALVARPSAAARLNDTAALLATCITLHTGAVTRDSGRSVRSERSDQSLAIDQDGQGSTPVGQESASAPAPAKGNSDSRDVRRQQAFDALFRHVLQSYEAHLATRGEIDFNDMIAGAAERLDAARGDPALRQRVAPLIPFRYLLVDEFQDISAGRAGLVKALRRARPGMKLLAVGDDWQSIYRFAGSDVSIMTGFEGHFGHTETRFLRQTFRFDQRLEGVASAFVLRNPAQIRKQVEARQATTDAPSVVLWLHGEDTADDPMPAIAVDLFGPPLADPLSIGIATQGVSAASCPASVPATPTPATPAPAFPAQAPPDILILGRYRALEAQARLDWLAAHYPQARWRYSTIHRAKGATADYAVVLGVRSGRQPFPVERPDDPLLAGFLGVVEAFPHAEERRLFYVALTRARHRVYVVGDRRQPSPFFEELLAQGGDVSLRPSDPASASSPA